MVWFPHWCQDFFIPKYTNSTDIMIYIIPLYPSWILYHTVDVIWIIWLSKPSFFVHFWNRLEITRTVLKFITGRHILSCNFDKYSIDHNTLLWFVCRLIIIIILFNENLEPLIICSHFCPVSKVDPCTCKVLGNSSIRWRGVRRDQEHGFITAST